MEHLLAEFLSYVSGSKDFSSVMSYINKEDIRINVIVVQTHLNVLFNVGYTLVGLQNGCNKYKGVNIFGNTMYVIGFFFNGIFRKK